MKITQINSNLNQSRASKNNNVSFGMKFELDLNLLKEEFAKQPIVEGIRLQWLEEIKAHINNINSKQREKISDWMDNYAEENVSNLSPNYFKGKKPQEVIPNYYGKTYKLTDFSIKNYQEEGSDVLIVAKQIGVKKPSELNYLERATNDYWRKLYPIEYKEALIRAVDGVVDSVYSKLILNSPKYRAFLAKHGSN